ncbi:velvet factor-domain-containing protein [Syncephalastrum racemosum]|uniref:Velvet factor-domain-containing protein n=1 Tax=Syncephalastrum racemosum TaxID=13706 RepID=A0A1X2H1R3_SYNRA|nr:velvet factor-domain-containing protein [Syncephalastrum racemosum]
MTSGRYPYHQQHSMLQYRSVHPPSPPYASVGGGIGQQRRDNNLGSSRDNNNNNNNGTVTPTPTTTAAGPAGLSNSYRRDNHAPLPGSSSSSSSSPASASASRVMHAPYHHHSSSSTLDPPEDHVNQRPSDIAGASHDPSLPVPSSPYVHCGPKGFDEREKRTYELVVCQQPLHARMCGFGEKDRRPIDPPPIVKLIVQQESEGGSVPVDIHSLQTPFFVLHVTLWSADREEERNIISNPPKCTRVLMGSLVSSPSLLKNPEGEQGLYFAFPDLSIRTEGRYTLRFSLMKLSSSDFQADAKSKIIAQVFSDPFTVYSAKKFPGMTESTELSKVFAKQGLKIPIRNDVRVRKND